jgi:hypothetical protein
MNGNISETMRRLFPVIVLLLAQREAPRCALLIVSSEEAKDWLPVHADVMTPIAIGAEPGKRRTHAVSEVQRGCSVHHRRSRGPNIAPAKVHSAMVPPYQSATKGSESSVQCSA